MHSGEIGALSRFARALRVWRVTLQPNLPCYESNLAIHERLGRTLLRSGYFLVGVDSGRARVRGRGQTARVSQL